MRPRSPFDYDVSVAADKRRRQRVRGMTGAFAGTNRCCEWQGCEAAAQYRAPRSPKQLNQYRWFCLDHVRQYNAGWNFFADWSEEEFENFASAGRVWERPTWTFGRGPAYAAGLHPHAEGNAWARFGFRDLFEVLGENATLNPGPVEDREVVRRRLSREEREAMDVLGLSYRVETRAEVRACYRDLIMRLHPDMNGGQNPEPERLARVLKAWQVLRKSPNFVD